ncbi:Acid_phosphatase [Hexamita inflata]|uniref:Acid phosphatase n=1 Tax=Hexamita inflata TaxID=28002 RepID=A0AA86PC11_9EUKA|nr:Acid phosphatase [Hexamita inflata]
MFINYLCACATPRQVLIVTRHGIRTSLFPYPNDTAVWNCFKNNQFNFQSIYESHIKQEALKLHFNVKNIAPGSCYKGQLADQGYAQHENLHQIWKRLYPSIFTNTHQRSTNSHRTRQSLLGQLQSTNLIHVSTWTMDTAFLAENCKTDHRYWARVQSNYDFKQSELQKLQEKTNWKVGWNQFADNLRARYAMGTKFPEALNLADYQLILNVKDQLWCYVYQRHQNIEELTKYQKMAIGPFLQDLKDYINNKTVFKIVSGHDVVITALAGVLVEEWVCAQPDYASFMAFEIYGDVLKIRYRHSGEDEGVYVKQKACMQTECQVSDVIKFFEKYIITMQERMEL